MARKNSKVCASSNTNLDEIPFHYVMFCDKEKGDLSSKIYRVFFGGIS